MIFVVSSKYPAITVSGFLIIQSGGSMAGTSVSESLNSSYVYTNTDLGNESSTSKGTDLTTPLNDANIGAVLSHISNKVSYCWENIGHCLRLNFSTISSIANEFKDSSSCFRSMINRWIQAGEHNQYTLGYLMQRLQKVDQLHSVCQELNELFKRENIFPAPDLRADTSTQPVDNEARFRALKKLFTEHQHLLNVVDISSEALGNGLMLNCAEISEIVTDVHNPSEQRKRIVSQWLEQQGRGARFEQLEQTLRLNQLNSYVYELKEQYHELLRVESFDGTPQAKKQCVIEMSQKITQLKQANARLTTQNSQFQQTIKELSNELKVKHEKYLGQGERIRMLLQQLQQIKQLQVEKSELELQKLQWQTKERELEQQLRQANHELSQANLNVIHLQTQIQKQMQPQTELTASPSKHQHQRQHPYHPSPSSRFNTEQQTSIQVPASVSISTAVGEQDAFMQAFSDTKRGSNDAEMFPLMKVADESHFDYDLWEALATKLGFHETDIKGIRTDKKGESKKCWKEMNAELLTRSVGSRFGRTYRVYANAVYKVYCENGEKQKAVNMGLAFLDAKFTE